MYILDKQAPFIYIFVYLLQSEPSQSELKPHTIVTQFHVIYRTIAKVTYLNNCCRNTPQFFFNILSQLCAFSLMGAFHIKYQIDLSFVFFIKQMFLFPYRIFFLFLESFVRKCFLFCWFFLIQGNLKIVLCWFSFDVIQCWRSSHWKPNIIYSKS